MKEIGSEFWTEKLSENDNDLKLLNIGCDYKLLMSGRTAIDYVLNELDFDEKIVYMPNYCCESMIQPFLDNGYRIQFYDVDVINNKYNIDTKFNCSVFFAMSYFGYNASNMDKYIEKFNKRNIVVIEDITHRLLCDINHSKYSNYLICSLRKWFPLLSGGVAISLCHKFKNGLDNYEINNKFIDIKQKAMNLKRDYMNNKDMDKNVFLELYNQSNKMIKNYKNMKMDDISINILKHLDINKIKNSRINNCKLIEEKVSTNKNIKLLYKYAEGDCPLFVPILIDNGNEIRKQLIVNSIYVPIHWPNVYDINNKIYEKELSLINDQRYCKDDIENYINKLIEIVGD